MNVQLHGIRAKTMAGGMAPVALVLILSITTWMSIRSMSESAALKDQSYGVIQKAARIEQGAVDMETGLRGYLLTGNEIFLKPYNAAESRIFEDMAQLKPMLESKSALEVLDQIEAIVKQWKQQIAEPEIALRRQIGDGKDMNHMAVMVGEGTSKRSFDRLREMMKSFIDLEESSLNQRVEWQTAETDERRLKTAMTWMISENELIKEALKLATNAVSIETGVRGYLLTGKDDFLEPYRVGRVQFFQRLDQLKYALLEKPDQVKLLGEIETHMKDWIADVVQPEVELRREIAESKTMMDINVLVSKQEGRKLFDQLRGLLETFKAEEFALLRTRGDNAAATEARAYQVLLFGTLLTMAAALLVAFVLSGAITRPLLHAVDLAVAISEGDLTRRLPIKKHDEVGRLCSALNTMGESLRNQTKQTLDAVDVLSTLAAQLSTSVAQLAASTARTSAAITETAITVEEVKQSATLSSNQAQHVSQLARKAVNITEGGKKAAEEGINRMHFIRDEMESIGGTVVKLSELGEQIETIIAAVQDLAAQSNLLAVNASIEAARAGDQGKSFAVVAHEIKNLADQSKQATEQVRSILEETRKWVGAVVVATEQGSKSVDAGLRHSVRAEETIQLLSSSISESADAAGVIEASGGQQLAGVEQVAMAMANIEHAMQQNLSGTAQLESAARKLQDVGTQLKDLTERYRV